MIVTIWNWLKAWFDTGAFGAGNGVSLSRRLMTVLVLAVAFSLVYDAIKHGISPSWAAVATGIGSTLAGIWGVSKWRRPPEEHHG